MGFREEDELLADREQALIDADDRVEGFGSLSDAEIEELDRWYDAQDRASAAIIEEAERNAQWIDAWCEAEVMLDLV